MQRVNGRSLPFSPADEGVLTTAVTDAEWAMLSP